MPIIPRLVEKLQRHPKRFVFPEGADPRVLQAARQIVTRRMGAPILLGDRQVIKDNAAQGVSGDGGEERARSLVQPARNAAGVARR